MVSLLPLILAVLVFGAALVFKRHRTEAFVVGAVTVSLASVSLGQQSADDVLTSLHRYLPVLLLIAAVEVFAACVIDLGLASAFAALVARKGLGKKAFVVVFCTIVYSVSLVLNNLTALLMLTPLLLRLRSVWGIERREAQRILVLAVIVSNLGGASTHIGDFPNMVIYQSIGATPADFLINLGAPILVMVVLLLLWARRGTSEAKGWLNDLAAYYEATPAGVVRWQAIIFGAILLLAVVGLILLPTFWNVAPALVAWPPAALLILFFYRKAGVLHKIDISVLFLFGALFVLADSIRHTGIFDSLANWGLSREIGPTYAGLMLLYVSFLGAALFSAGPMTAALAPLAVALSPLIDDSGKLAWWILSLGVLAGSSVTMVGATGGLVACGMYTQRTGDDFSLFRFSSYALAPSLFILAAGTVYVLARTWQ